MPRWHLKTFPDSLVIFAAVISISNISYLIGGRPIYDSASLAIHPNDKIGLIGLNGTGKTTLLKLITGELSVDDGSISRSNDCTLGFLNQDLLSFESSDSILHVAMGAFEEALGAQHRLEKVLKELETRHTDALLTEAGDLQHEFERLGGYTMQAQTEEVLEGIGFATTDLNRPLNEFSGGWRMRVMLAKLLLQRPSLLMLDEPTNHLDMPSIEWVENYLQDYQGAAIIVSHDQDFLDRVVTRTVEVTNQQLVVYEGNYSFYKKEKELREQIQQNAFENQQQKIRQTERFIERFRYKATKARQVQSRIKSLEKMDKIDEVVSEAPSIDFRFAFSRPSGRHVMRLNDISKSYDTLHLLERTNAVIERGDKIALIGANGRGKSTLLRVLAGTEAFSGLREEGHNVTTAFYAQHQLESLGADNEALEELKQFGSGRTEQELRNVLGCFLFSGDDVFKKIKVLSGGERSRVALAKTLISDANFLLLDEPTNHLDFISIGILIQALQQFQGTAIIVSHDRHFIGEIANKIWYIEDRQIKAYPGTYHEYRELKDRQTVSAPAEKKAARPKPQPKPSNIDRTKKLEKNLEALETEIGKLERRKSEVERELIKPEVYGNFERLSEAQTNFEHVVRLLETANKKWEELIITLDRQKADR